MNIKLKIRPSRRKKRRPRSTILNLQELSPEKQRKIEELRLARGEIINQIESQKELAAEPSEEIFTPAFKVPDTPLPVEVFSFPPKEVDIPPPKEEFVAPPTVEYEPPPKDEDVSEPREEHIQPPKEEYIPPPKDEDVPPPKGELIPPSFGAYTKPPKKSRFQRPKKSRVQRPKKVPALSQQRDTLCRKIIEWGIIGLLVFSPLPAASVNKWSVLLIQLTVFVMFGAYVLMNKKPKIHPQLSSTFKWPKYLFTALFILIVVQMTPLPKFLIKGLSPSTHSLRDLFTPDYLQTEFMGISLIPSYTFQKGLELLAYFLLGYLIIKTVTGRRQIMRIFYVLIGMGVFQALYGFFELYNRNPRILFYEKLEYLDCVTGTFINRNHLSGYLEMILPIAIGIVLARTEYFDLSGLSWKNKLLQFTESKALVKMLIPVCIIVMALAIIFSKSRSGIFLLILTFLLIFQFLVLNFKRSSYRKRMIARYLKITFLVITIVALYIGIEGVIKRFSMERFLHEYRPIFWSQTVRIVEDFPLFGSGLGTFESLYPAYAKSSVPAPLSHAHNDYLEYLSELGLFGLIFLLGGIIALFVRAFLVWRKRTHPFVKGLGLGGFIAIILLLFHSITDFNLHIPANMILFAVVLSLLAVTVFYQKSETDDSDPGGASEKEKDIDAESNEGKYKEEIKEWQKFINQDEKSVIKEVIAIVSAVILVMTVIALAWNNFFFERGKATENSSAKAPTSVGQDSPYESQAAGHVAHHQGTLYAHQRGGATTGVHANRVGLTRHRD